MSQSTARPSGEEILKFTVELAREAGNLIVQARASSNLKTDYKNEVELVTSADIAADKLINEAISSRFPGHGILSEEAAPNYPTEKWSRGALWIIDPIDGTVNYAHGHFMSAVCIAYAVDGVVQVGVVHCPFLNETFSAVKGQGAWLNDQPIRASQKADLKKALIATGFPHQREDLSPLLDRVRKLLGNCLDIRRGGSAALDMCWVACGRLDGYSETIKAWDMAASALIAREAGAITGHLGPVPAPVPADLHGEGFVTAGPAIYPKLHALLKS